MFLGNDFGTLKSFKKVLPRGYEDVPTWRHLRQRLNKATIPGEIGFYTNAVLGLRTDKNALGKTDWSCDPDFCQFVGEFLRFQLEMMKPRLLVVLGSNAKNTVCTTLEADIPGIALWREKELSSMESAETIQVVEWRKRKLVMHLTSHPYSDLRKDDARKAETVQRLKQAWETATA